MTGPVKRPRIDWGAALAWYVAMTPPRTLGAVARQFGVSEAAVRNHAKPGADTPEGWAAVAVEVDRRAAEKALAKAQRTVEQRSAQLLRIYDAAADRVEAGITVDENGVASIDVDTVFAKFPDLHRMMRLETEQATDHVALAEVQAGFRAAMRVAIETAALVAGEQLGERRARELVARYRELFLPAVNEAIAIGPGGDA